MDRLKYFLLKSLLLQFGFFSDYSIWFRLANVNGVIPALRFT